MNDYVYLTSYHWDLSYDVSVPLNSFIIMEDKHEM